MRPTLGGTSPPNTSAQDVAAASAPVEPEPPRRDGDKEPKLGLARERIVSAATSGAAAAAFAQLGTLPREKRREGENVKRSD